MASIKLKGDTSGEVTISAPAVAGTTTLELPATSSTLATQNALGVRNLIINGDMRIDQRNGGNVKTIGNGSTNTNYIDYTVDRWQAQSYTSGGVTGGFEFTVQQVSDAPDNFTNSTKITVTTAKATLAAQDVARIQQPIEGYNIAHLKWGTSAAKDITISFWVKSSLTGTFGGAIHSGSGTIHSYPFTYTISAANTWEKKTITIAGYTSGTWSTTNGMGLKLCFSLGVGSDWSNTAFSWTTGTMLGATGETSIVSTSGATWYFTGVQLEADTDTATPFEHRPYDMELARCMRYYEKSFPVDVAPNHMTGYNRFVPHSGSAGCGGNTYTSELFRVEKRANPTLRIFDSNGTGTFSTNLARTFTACNSGSQVSTMALTANKVGLNGYIQGGTAVTIAFNWTAEAEL